MPTINTKDTAAAIPRPPLIWQPELRKGTEQSNNRGNENNESSCKCHRAEGFHDETLHSQPHVLVECNSNSNCSDKRMATDTQECRAIANTAYRVWEVPAYSPRCRELPCTGHEAVLFSR